MTSIWRGVLVVMLLTMCGSARFVCGDDDATLPAVVFPADAIIVPYSPDAFPGDDAPSADTLTHPTQSIWVPYLQYVELLGAKRSHAAWQKSQIPAPLPFLVTAADYSATLPPTGSTALTIRGKLTINVFTQESVAVPLSLAGGVLESVALDGKPASLQSVSETQLVLVIDGDNKATTQNAPTMAASRVHTLTFDVRVRLQRQGGWYIATGTLPTAVATRATITPSSTEIGGELLAAHELDKRKWTLTRSPIETSLAAGGNFAWQWRNATSEATVDRHLEVESQVRVALQEDGCWIDWLPTFRISRGKWDIVRVELPTDYTIVSVAGENVRGWSIKKSADDADERRLSPNGNDDNLRQSAQSADTTKQIDIELLKPAEGEERFTIRLLKNEQAANWELPQLSVPDAAIHRGRIDIYGSKSSKARVVETSGLALTDPPENATAAEGETASPLGMTVFQSYRFSSEGGRIKLAVSPVTDSPRADIETVLKIAPRRMVDANGNSSETIESVVESSITFSGETRPFDAIVRLPKSLTVRNIKASEGVIAAADENGQIYVRVGAGPRTLVIEGDFSAIAADAPFTLTSLPNITVDFPQRKDANTRNEQRIVVLVDPSLDARLEDLKDAYAQPVANFTGSLLPEQRNLARLALITHNDSFSGRIVLGRRVPDVKCSTITNVRASGQSLDETILLDYTIQNASVRAVTFELPAWMRDAQIDAPLLARKIIVPVHGSQVASPVGSSVFLTQRHGGTEENSPLRASVPPCETPDRVAVTLELQEAVMGQFRVLIRADRPLQSGTVYTESVPRLPRGETGRQFIVLENGRGSQDEIVVDDTASRGVVPLKREQREWSYLASILGSEFAGRSVTAAYLATQSSDDNTEKILGFVMRRRETVRLAEARIDLAETRVLLGPRGEYRAEQIYRIDNKKEPYLDIALPEGASLWGVRMLTSDQWQRREAGATNVTGVPVKPCQMPAEVAARYEEKIPHKVAWLVRIPLVKTESGDLDYVVRIVYAGSVPPWRTLKPCEVPLMAALNIPVGESLVRLYLPDDFIYRFSGNLQGVALARSEAAIRESVNNYNLKQVTRLQQASQSDNVYAQQRAYSNSVNFQQQVGMPVSGITITGGSSLVNNTQTDSLGQQVAGTANAANTFAASNDSQLASQFAGQSNVRTGNLVQRQSLVTSQTLNDVQTANGRADELRRKDSGEFKQQWFESNKLAENESGEVATATRELRDDERVMAPRGRETSMPRDEAAKNVNVIFSDSLEVSDKSQSEEAERLSRRNRSLDVSAGGKVVVGRSQRPGYLAQQNAPRAPMEEQQNRSSLQQQAVPQQRFTPEVPQAEQPFFTSSFSGAGGRTSGGIGMSSGGMQGGGMGMGGMGAMGMGGPAPSRPASPPPPMMPPMGGSGPIPTNAPVVLGEQVQLQGEGRFVQSGSEVTRGESDSDSDSEPSLRGLTTRTASLDIDVPYQQSGVTMYLFTTPQGNLELTLRPIPRALVSQLVRAVTTLGLVLCSAAFLASAWYVVSRNATRLTRLSHKAHRRLAILLTFLTVLSLFLNPFVFVVVLVLTVAAWATLRSEREA
ncbi:MAG: hypothetical protein ACRC46_07355 [Thermoguttaceae bacterium]